MMIAEVVQYEELVSRIKAEFDKSSPRKFLRSLKLN